MSLLSMWLIGWLACSLGSALVFAWWAHAMKQHGLSRQPIAPNSATTQGQDLAG